MTEKCYFCEDELKRTFLDKIVGTQVKVKDKEKNKFVYICSICQAKHKDKLRKEIEKKR